MIESTDLSLAASIASLVLAVVAIGLSIVFYAMSARLQKETTQAAEKIGSSVDRLEALFDRLYSDTFSMMRETVTDMRKHIWPEPAGDEIEAQEDERVEVRMGELRQEFQKELEDIARQSGSAVSELEGKLVPLVNEALSKGREVEVEAKEATIRSTILRVFRQAAGGRSAMRSMGIRAEDLVDQLEERGFSPGEVIREVELLRDGGILFYDGNLGPQTRVFRTEVALQRWRDQVQRMRDHQADLRRQRSHERTEPGEEHGTDSPG